MKHLTNEQTCRFFRHGEIAEMTLPSETSTVWKDIKWGNVAKTFTPAYWKAQVVMSLDGIEKDTRYRTSGSLSDEICACLLGGYGITAEMSYAAFEKLKCAGLTSPIPDMEYDELNRRIYEVLSAGLMIAGRLVHYRFPRQKARCLALALVKLSTEKSPAGDLEFRAWLLTFVGIGPKTASWITRNWYGSKNVAIIDIHIFRACTLMGLFKGNENVSKNYLGLEKKILGLAMAMRVNPADMDMVMWTRMREMGKFGTDSFNAYCTCHHVKE